MLKPRYRSLSEAVGDFKALLGDMDVRHPKDSTIIPTEAPKPETTAQQTEPKRPAMMEHAPLSRYSSSQTAMDSFRVLAGLEVQESVPRDAGVVGTTRHTAAIMSEDTVSNLDLSRTVVHESYAFSRDDFAGDHEDLAQLHEALARRHQGTPLARLHKEMAHAHHQHQHHEAFAEISSEEQLDEFIGALAAGLGRFAAGAGRAAAGAARAVGQGAAKAGQAAWAGAKKVGPAALAGVKKLGQAAATGAQAVGQGLANAAIKAAPLSGAPSFADPVGDDEDPNKKKQLKPVSVYKVMKRVPPPLPPVGGRTESVSRSKTLLAENEAHAEPSDEPERDDPFAKTTVDAPKEPHYHTYGKKISQHALQRSYIFRHTKGDMTDDEKVKRHQALSGLHSMTANKLKQLAQHALGKGDRKGGIALTNVSRLHSNLSSLHGSKKHHKMFDEALDVAQLADDLYEASFDSSLFAEVLGE